MTIADDQSTEISPDVLERVYDRRRPGPRPDIHPDLLRGPIAASSPKMPTTTR